MCLFSFLGFPTTLMQPSVLSTELSCNVNYKLYSLQGVGLQVGYCPVAIAQVNNPRRFRFHNSS